METRNGKEKKERQGERMRVRKNSQERGRGIVEKLFSN